MTTTNGALVRGNVGRELATMLAITAVVFAAILL